MKVKEKRDEVVQLREELKDLLQKRTAEGLDEAGEKRFLELTDAVEDGERELRAMQALEDSRVTSPYAVLNEERCAVEQDEVFLEAVERSMKDRTQVGFEIHNRSGITSTDVKAVTLDLHKGLLEPLMANSILKKAGAIWETGVQGEPVWASYGQVEVELVNETEALTDTKISSEIKPQPHHLCISIPLKHRGLNSNNYNLRTKIFREMRKALDEKLNRWAFYAEDSAGKFTKATKNPFAEIIEENKAKTYNSDIKWSDLVDLETAVLEADVKGAGCYIMHPIDYQKMKYTPVVGDTIPAFVAGGLGIRETLLPNGARVEVSTVLPKGYVYYGVFDNLAVTQFGAFNFVVDGHTLSTKEQVLFKVYTAFDITPLRKEAFAVLKKVE